MNYLYFLNKELCGKICCIYNLYSKKEEEYKISYIGDVGFELKKDNKKIPYLARFGIFYNDKIIKKITFNLNNEYEYKEYVQLLTQSLKKENGYSFKLVIKPQKNDFIIMNSDLKLICADKNFTPNIIGEHK